MCLEKGYENLLFATQFDERNLSTASLTFYLLSNIESLLTACTVPLKFERHSYKVHSVYNVYAPIQCKFWCFCFQSHRMA